MFLRYYGTNMALDYGKDFYSERSHVETVGRRRVRTSGAREGGSIVRVFERRHDAPNAVHTGLMTYKWPTDVENPQFPIRMFVDDAPIRFYNVMKIEVLATFPPQYAEEEQR